MFIPREMLIQNHAQVSSMRNLLDLACLQALVNDFKILKYCPALDIYQMKVHLCFSTCNETNYLVYNMAGNLLRTKSSKTHNSHFVWLCRIIFILIICIDMFCYV